MANAEDATQEKLKRIRKPKLELRPRISHTHIVLLKNKKKKRDINPESEREGDKS